MQCGSELDPIPIILRPGEFVESYERLFRKWLNYRNVIYEALQSDPEEERRYRQSYAYLRAWQQKQRWRFLENSSSWNSWDRNSSRDHGGGIKRKDRCSRNNRLRDLDFPWERNHYEKFESRERRRNGKRLRLNSADMESFNDGVINSTSSWNSSSTALSSPTPVCVELEKETGASGHEVAGSGAIFCKLEQPNRHALDKPPEHSEEDFNFVAVNVDTASEPGITSKHLDPTDIIQASVELVTKAEQVGLDPAKLRLIEDYIHFHDQIVVNEVAIEDLLAHIRATDTITEEESTENLSLIEEALVSVNEVKSKRALALAAIVGYDDETLPAQHFQLTQENSVSDSDSHERLALVHM
ncbi:hypothetical protein PHPALM_18129 [Phytophthora palmivora]|uniref:Uncharacterized protein n=1 Tax=Phytophthora palmivora TaxID=4796 RepID=A0A2P4XKI3_9STRA|nr:hypothetical protein PHPALM_18129 [Phytophthora palmivora]